jgi:uncharacterized protein (DUF362 family)
MEHKRSPVRAPNSSTFSRREFLKLTLMGLLAGCAPLRKAIPLPTDVPTPAQWPATETPSQPQTNTIFSQATQTPVATQTSYVQISNRKHPPVIRFYPDTLSRVVHMHHNGVWEGKTLVPDVLGQMLDASITQLTGLNDVNEAWLALFKPEERIAIKVNTIAGSSDWTHAPLVMAVAEKLAAIGIPPEQITIYDRNIGEMTGAGYAENRDSPGVRCYGTDFDYVEGFTVIDVPVRLSSILMNHDALINMPILKQHGIAGISFSMKNHYGTIDRPGNFHSGNYLSRGLAEINALEPIASRTRLIVGDLLTVVLGDSWNRRVKGNAILMSFDPVAIDFAAQQVFKEVTASLGGAPKLHLQRSNAWLESGAELGLGTNDPANMDYKEINLS